MHPDPIVEEVRRIRAELAAKHGYNAHAIAEEARRQEKTCGHEVVDLSKKQKTG